MLKTNKKKGVSPVTTTVVLTSLVVASVLIVTLWGKGVQEQLESKEGGIALAKLSCTGINFNIHDAGGSVMVENEGPDLDGVMLVVQGNGDVQSQLYVQPIKRGNERSFPYQNIPGVPDVDEVSVIPTIGEGIYRPCIDQKKELSF
jgi:hypothetical protein